MYLSTLFFFVVFFRLLYLEGTLYKFATNSQILSYSKLHLRQVHHIFLFFQRNSINGANYIWTKCTQVACWLRMDPVCSLLITLSCKRASSEEKYHVLAFTFKTVLHKQQMLWRKQSLSLGVTQGRNLPILLSLNIYICIYIYIL